MKYYIIFLMFIMASGPVHADELHVVLNGKAIHLDDGDYNEQNWGLGFEYDFAPRNKWIRLINGSSFKDSNNNTSKYLGMGLKRRYLLSDDPEGWHVDVGGFVFLMTRQDFHDGDPFLGALPVVSLGTPRFAINATYIPEVSPKHKDLLYFQVMFRVSEF